MAENDYMDHELLKQPEAPPPEPAQVEPKGTDKPRDERGRFASEGELSDESAPDSETVEAAADDEPVEDQDASDGESVDESEQETPEKSRRRRSAGERISQLTAQKREAEAREQQARQELAELREYLQQQVDPDLEFSDPARFTQESVRRALAEQRANDAAIQYQRAHQSQFEADKAMFMERLEVMRDELPDFDQVVLNNTSLPIDPEMVSFFASSDVGPKIAHHLGKNPCLAQKIAQLPPALKGAELARLEAKVSTPPPRRTTKAPPPTRQIQATGPSGGFDPQRDGVDAFKRLIYGKQG